MMRKMMRKITKIIAFLFFLTENIMSKNKIMNLPILPNDVH